MTAGPRHPGRPGQLVWEGLQDAAPSRVPGGRRGCWRTDHTLTSTGVASVRFVPNYVLVKNIFHTMTHKAV